MKAFDQVCLERIRTIDATRTVGSGQDFSSSLDKLILDCLLDKSLQRPTAVSDLPTFVTALVYDYVNGRTAAGERAYVNGEFQTTGSLVVISVDPPLGKLSDDTVVTVRPNGRVYANTRYQYRRRGAEYEIDGEPYRANPIRDDEFEGPADPGIICRPRAGSIVSLRYSRVRVDYGVAYDYYSLPGIRGGFELKQDGIEDFDSGSLCPFDPEKKAAFLYSKKDGSKFQGLASFYGNLHSVDPSGKRVLSWRGTPTRHFRLPSDTRIDGSLSHVERSPTTSWEESVPEFTSFWTELYEGGSVCKRAPKYSWPKGGNDVDGRCLIQGALITEAGTTYAATISDHQQAPKYVYVFTDGHRQDAEDSSVKTDYLAAHPGVGLKWEGKPVKPGFYLTLWKGGAVLDGWEMVSERSYSRNGLPWFPNELCTQFECTNGDKLKLDGTFAASPAVTTGEWHEAGDLTFGATYATDQFFEAGKRCNVSLLFSADSTFASVPDKIKVYDGSYPVMRRATTPAVEGPSGWSYAPDYYKNYTVHGGEGPYSWTYPSSAGCAGPGHDAAIGQVTATDCKGRMGTKDVMLPGGTWVYDHGEGVCSSYCNDYGMPGSFSEVVGLEKHVYQFYWSGFTSMEEYNSWSPPENSPSWGLTYGFNWGCGGETVGHVSHFPWKSPGTGPLHNEWDWLMGACGRHPPFGSCGGCGVCGSELIGAVLSATCKAVYKWVCP